jgi:hypothetical protein
MLTLHMYRLLIAGCLRCVSDFGMRVCFFSVLYFRMFDFANVWVVSGWRLEFRLHDTQTSEGHRDGVLESDLLCLSGCVTSGWYIESKQSS